MSASGEGPAAVATAVAVSTASQLVAKLAHLALNVVASLALIRYLQPEGYGDYIFVLSLAAIFGLLSDFGLPKVAVREISRDPDDGPTILGTTVGARALLAVLAWVLAQAMAIAIGAQPEIRLAIAVGSLVYLTDALLTVVVVFEVRLAMQYEALVLVLAQAFDTALILALIASGAGLVQLVAAPVASAAVAALLALWLARGRFGTRLAIDPRRIPRLLRDAAPVGVALLIAVAYLKLDSVLLGVLATPHDVGIYGSAYRPIEYLLLGSGVLITPLFPLLSRWHGMERTWFSAVYRRGTDALVAAWLPVPVLLFWIADPLVAAVYGAAFAPAAVPLRLLAIALVMMILAAWQGLTLLAAGRQPLTTIYNAAGLGVNVALNLVLIPRLGYAGAAWAALATSAFVWACSWICVRRLAAVQGVAGRILPIVAANLVLAIAVGALLALGASWWLAALVSSLLYPLVLLGARATSFGELRRLLPGRQAVQRALEVHP